jgi:hypothetical protein
MPNCGTPVLLKTFAVTCQNLCSQTCCLCTLTLHYALFELNLISFPCSRHPFDGDCQIARLAVD